MSDTPEQRHVRDEKAHSQNDTDNPICDVDGYGVPETMDEVLSEAEEPQLVELQESSKGESLHEMLSPADNDDDDGPLEIDSAAENNQVAADAVDDLAEEEDWREFEEASEPNPYAIEDGKEQEEEDWGNFAEAPAPTERKTRINLWTLDQQQFLEETQKRATEICSQFESIPGEVEWHRQFPEDLSSLLQRWKSSPTDDDSTKDDAAFYASGLCKRLFQRLGVTEPERPVFPLKGSPIRTRQALSELPTTTSDLLFPRCRVFDNTVDNPSANSLMDESGDADPNLVGCEGEDEAANALASETTLQTSMLGLAVSSASPPISSRQSSGSSVLDGLRTMVSALPDLSSMRSNNIRLP